jgi:hypothetical protein
LIFSLSLVVVAVLHITAVLQALLVAVLADTGIVTGHQAVIHLLKQLLGLSSIQITQ